MSVARGAFLGCAVTVFSILSMATAADAQEAGDPTTKANRMAYEASMKCFVVDTRLSALRRRAGDEAKSTYYDDRSKAAFDAAVALGQKIGRRKDEIERDFNIVQVRELPELLRDDGYMRSAIAACKALGLT